MNSFKLKKVAMTVAILMTVFLHSCSDDPEPVIPGEEGFFIVNEGAFGNSNASLSFYDREKDQVVNYVFKTKNGRDLGDQAQSVTVFEEKAYVVVQNDGKVEVIDAGDYASVATIDSEIESPRYFIGISSGKGYVSDWGADGISGSVKVVDLNSNTVTKTIPVGKGPNRMLKIGALVYVANAGGYGTDNTVKIIDTNDDIVTGSITVGDNPNSLVRDSDGSIWVTAGGTLAFKPDFSIDEANSTKGSLSKISSGNAEMFRLEVDAFSYSSISNLSISPDGKKLYYTFNGSVYSLSTSSTVLPTVQFKVKSYYGLAVDPFNGNVIGCDAPDFSSAGKIDIMDSSGDLIKSFDVGIGPSGCGFK